MCGLSEHPICFEHTAIRVIDLAEVLHQGMVHDNGLVVIFLQHEGLLLVVYHVGYGLAYPFLHAFISSSFIYQNWGPIKFMSSKPQIPNIRMH